MNRQTVPLLGLLLVAAIGCNSLEGYPRRSLDVDRQLKALAKYFEPQVYEKYEQLPDDAAKRKYRNEVVYAQLYAIDLHFSEFQKAVYKENVGTNIASDVAVIGVSGAGAVVGPASTKSILAAISGGITGSKQSVDKHLYYEKTMPAMMAQMEAGRRTARVRIEQGLASDVQTYPLGLALLDLDAYYEAGTLPAAVRGIVQVAGNAIQKADEELSSFRSDRYIQDAAGEALRTFWKPDGKTPNEENQKKIESWIKNDAWMKEHGFTDVSILLFMRGATFAEARLRAARDLGLIP